MILNFGAIPKYCLKFLIFQYNFLISQLATLAAKKWLTMLELYQNMAIIQYN